MDDFDSEWRDKGAALNDKTARKEYGLTQEEIVGAIRAGKLRYQRLKTEIVELEKRKSDLIASLGG